MYTILYKDTVRPLDAAQLSQNLRLVITPCDRHQVSDMTPSCISGKPLTGLHARNCRIIIKDNLHQFAHATAKLVCDSSSQCEYQDDWPPL